MESDWLSPELIAGVTVGAIGLLGVMTGAWATRRHDQKRWLQERRLQAVSEFVQNHSLLYDRMLRGVHENLSPAELVESRHLMQMGRTEIHLLCTEKTFLAAEHLNELTRKISPASSDAQKADAIRALQTFVELARKDVLKP